MVAVVGEQQAAGLDELDEVLALGRAEPHQRVAGHEEEGKRRQLDRIGGDHDFFRIDRDVGVLEHGVQHVGGDLGVVVPVA